ncbi:MAG: bifunctional folylpolyglutamate synthase/dihydrofolate synthase [Clostridia bacterium]|nr:bifunctional folylpolyglutamate synthase/dihydrofolate synthase [Clostridia bacterium]
MTDKNRNPHAFHNVVRLGLERITNLLEKLGRPDRKLKFVHVAGTNGKGSTCAFIEAALVKDGKKTGKFTSPNLVRVNERICINGNDIPDFDLERVLTAAEEASKFVENETGEAPTQFEIWCAAAMLYFAQQKCDIVVLEVGLGGEYDATNVIEKCELAVICHIDIDHTAYLGDTLEEIAHAKCGIIKDGIAARTVVTGTQYPEVTELIRARAKEHGHTLTVAETPEPIGFDGIYEYYIMPDGERVKLALGGSYQLANAAVAHAALKALGLPDASIKAGLESASHRGRFEMIADGVIFDGGHNPDGVRALEASLDRYFCDTPMTVIYACMADKDIKTTLSTLTRKDREFICTTVQGNPRAMMPEALRDYARENCKVSGIAAPSLRDALALAKSRGRLTIICGSLYLYGDL